MYINGDNRPASNYRFVHCTLMYSYSVYCKCIMYSVQNNSIHYAVYSTCISHYLEV